MRDCFKWKFVGDQEADAVAQDVYDNDPEFGGARFFDLMRAFGPWVPQQPTEGLPPAIATYLRTDYKLPAWCDLAALRRAQEAYQPNAEIGKIVLAASSLPVLYISPDIAATLMGTGRLVLKVRNRLQETQTFVEVAMAPGALAGPGQSWQWMRKIRMTHAILRLMATLARPGRGAALAFGEADPHDPEHPLSVLRSQLSLSAQPAVAMSQLDLAYVLQTFAWVMVTSRNELGFPMGSTERDDHIRAWSIVGHMIGIVDDLLPGSDLTAVADRAENIFESVRSNFLTDAAAEAKSPRTCDDPLAERRLFEGGRILTEALLVVLVDVLRTCVPDRLRRWVLRFEWLDDALQSLPHTLVRGLVGRETARVLRVDRAPFLHWLIGRAALLFIDLRKWNERAGSQAHEAGAGLGLEVSSPASSLPRGLF